MSKIKILYKLLRKNPGGIFKVVGDYGYLNWIPDKAYLKMIFFLEIGKRLNLDNPQTYNEKLQWLKLYDRKPEYIRYVDKYAVRSYVSESIGEQYLIPLLGVYNCVEEIDWDSLPNQFVLKCTHGSGSNIICSDKEKLDIKGSKMMLNLWMKKSWFWFGREWPYKNIKPHIICEDYIVDESGIELKDFKIFCFNGEPKLIQVDFNRFIEHKRNLYTIDWQFVDASIEYPNQQSFIVPRPKKLDDMLRCARLLSRNMAHVRIDFYSINDQAFFGEMTFYHGSGYEKFEPESLGIKMGSWIQLP